MGVLTCVMNCVAAGAMCVPQRRSVPTQVGAVECCWLQLISLGVPTACGLSGFACETNLSFFSIPRSLEHNKRS